MPDEELKALLETPDEVDIGGRKFKIEPLSLYKTELVSDMVPDLIPLINSIRKFNPTESEIPKIFRSCSEQIAKGFVILTTSNGTWESDLIEPDLSPTNIGRVKRQLNSKNIVQILIIIRKSLDFKELLKNVLAQVALMQSSLGETSSPGPSSSPAGSSVTSPTESAFEV